jgi:hypothetical protein
MTLKNYCSNIIKLALVILLGFSCRQCYSQNNSFANAYAHNDYWHKHPLYDALNNGFTHVEADVYLREGKMVVTHILPMFNMNKTLEKLYLDPLQSCINGTNEKAVCPNFPIMLMIDIKSEANSTYKALKVIFNKYSSILSSYNNGVFTPRQITVVITGHKPVALIKSETNRMAFIDEDLMHVKQDTLTHRLYETASCKYSKIINWDGKGQFPDKERVNLCAYVAKAHQLGEKVRLWDSPENPVVWNELLLCGVDLINTDKLPELKAFLTKRMATIAALK